MQQTRAHKSFMHHVAWGIVCAILLAVLVGIWLHAKTLEAANIDLRKQLAVAKMPPTTCKVTGQWSPNASKELSVSTRDGERKYIVHVPIDFRDNQYYPLIFFYPGKGSSPLGSELSFGLDQLPAITVYPYPTTGTDGATAWESAPYASGADDVGFTANILDKMQTDMCIDKTRIYATGFSNGGGFASLLSCKLPGRFAAYAVVAGALYSPYSECKPTTPSPLISIHGDNDSIVPYNGVSSRNLPSVFDWTSMRAVTEKCNRPTTTYSGVNMVITAWNNCRSGSAVQNIRIIGGSHVWGAVPNDTLWQFLSRFSL